MDVSTFLKGANRSSIEKLGSDLNPHASQGPSSWAQKQLKKFGWSKGKGLGKKLDGRREHVKVKKKEDSGGIGQDEEDKKEEQKTYGIESFMNAYDKLAVKIGGNASSSDNDDDDSSDDGDDGGSFVGAPRSEYARLAAVVAASPAPGAGRHRLLQHRA